MGAQQTPEPEPYQCTLPSEMMRNKDCRFKQQLPKYREGGYKEPSTIIDIDVNYEDILTMEDVTTLGPSTNILFSDRSQVNSPITAPVAEVPVARRSVVDSQSQKKGVTKHFLKEYGDPANVPNSQTWNTEENMINSNNPTNSNNRIPNK